MSKKPILDKLKYHQMLDRLNVIQSIIDDHLQQHPVAKIETDIKDLISEAQDKLSEVHLIIRSKH